MKKDILGLFRSDVMPLPILIDIFVIPIKTSAAIQNSITIGHDSSIR